METAITILAFAIVAAVFEVKVTEKPVQTYSVTDEDFAAAVQYEKETMEHQ